ncbi:MAG: VWA domain-containing protein, partial [Lachnospiraceae bacterium]|nr:VWA domain-containing protein [Lachnospiraceae bacterium]
MKYNSDTKDYTLTLDVTGKTAGTEAGVDVLLVLDTSGSMGNAGTEAGGYYNLLPRLKEIVGTPDSQSSDTVIDTILTDGSKNRMALISFANSASLKKDWCDDTSKKDLKKAVKELSASGGTNWSNAMSKAEDTLKSAGGNNQKVVIFVSDGAPGERGYSSSYFENACNTVKNSTYLKDAKVYSVYLTTGTSTAMINFAGYMKMYGIDAEAIDGTQDMSGTIMNDVLSSFISTYSEVVIADKLSDYAEFSLPEGASEPMFTVTYKNGTTTKTFEPRTAGEYNEDGVKYEITRNDKSVVFKVYGKATGKKDDNDEPIYALENGATYSISYNIKTSEKAESEYKATGNPEGIFGEETTDAPGNSTSVGKRGFRSNEGEGATISYSENGKDSTLGTNYKHPVIQTQAEINDNLLQVDKTAKVKDWYERTYDITITAQSKAKGSETTTTTTNAEVMLVLDMSSSMCLKAQATDESFEPTFLGNFAAVKSTLDESKIYYKNKQGYQSGYHTPKRRDDNNRVDKGGYGYEWDNTDKGVYNYLKYPMVYVNDIWQYYDGSKWVTVKDTDPVAQWDSRLTVLKENMIEFINQQSSNTKVGVISFSESGSAKNEFSFAELAGEKRTDCIKSIAKMYTDGGTYINDALQTAGNTLSTAKNAGSDANQYIIVFCDGNVSDGENTVTNTAKTIKDRGVTIYTISFGGDFEKLENVPSDPKTKYKLSASDTSSLNTALGGITTEINNFDADIENAKVIDVIDPRFELVDVNGVPLKDGDEYYGGVIKTIDNKQCIEWTGVTLPNLAKEGNTEPWSRTITVKAKDGFIGGNNVPTNVSPDSKVIVGKDIGKELPLPHVNVKISKSEAEKTVTIYKGDTVPTDASIFEDILSEAKFGEYSLPEGVSNDLKWNLYEVNETTETKITEARNLDDIGDALKDVKPDSTKVYKLKVTYNAGDWTDSSNANTTISDKVYYNGDEASGQHEVTVFQATYTVNVISGSLAIEKELTVPTAKQTGETFSFTVKRRVESQVDTAEAEDSEVDAQAAEVEVDSAH